MMHTAATAVSVGRSVLPTFVANAVGCAYSAASGVLSAAASTLTPQHISDLVRPGQGLANVARRVTGCHSTQNYRKSVAVIDRSISINSFPVRSTPIGFAHLRPLYQSQQGTYPCQSIDIGDSFNCFFHTPVNDVSSNIRQALVLATCFRTSASTPECRARWTP